MESGNLTLSVVGFKTAKSTGEDALFSPQCKEEPAMRVLSPMCSRLMNYDCKNPENSVFMSHELHPDVSSMD